MSQWRTLRTACLFPYSLFFIFKIQKFIRAYPGILMSLWFFSSQIFSLKTFSFLLNLIIYVLAIFLFLPLKQLFLWSYLYHSYPWLSRPSFSSLWFCSWFTEKFLKSFPTSLIQLIFFICALYYLKCYFNFLLNFAFSYKQF